MSWKRKITDIRHAAVHRVAQNRQYLCEKLDIAIAFARVLGDSQCAQDMGNFKTCFETILDDLDEYSQQLDCRTKAQVYLCRCYPLKMRRRLLLLPEAVKRLNEQNERRFSSLVQGALRKCLFDGRCHLWLIPTR
jgi:hypothetical protein